MKRIGMGLVGPGFIAAHHVDAVRRLGDVDLVAIAGSTPESSAQKAKQLGCGPGLQRLPRFEAMLQSYAAGSTWTGIHFVPQPGAQES
jgi:predicted dehydrogenase